MSFSERVKQARENKGLTQSELAELVGAHPVTVSKWERGQSRPVKNQDYFALARALDVQPGWLLDGTESSGPDRGGAPWAQTVEDFATTRRPAGLRPRQRSLTASPAQQLLQNVLLDVQADKLQDEDAIQVALALQEALRKVRR